MPVLAKIALGLMTIWAVLYALAAVSMDFGVPPESGSLFGPAIQIASMIDVSVVFAVYAYIAFQTARMRAIEKSGWVFAMLFMYPLAVPLFWYLHVWRAARPAVPSGNARGPQ